MVPGTPARSRAGGELVVLSWSRLSVIRGFGCVTPGCRRARGALCCASRGLPGSGSSSPTGRSAVQLGRWHLQFTRAGADRGSDGRPVASLGTHAKKSLAGGGRASSERNDTPVQRISSCFVTSSSGSRASLPFFLMSSAGDRCSAGSNSARGDRLYATVDRAESYQDSGKATVNALQGRFRGPGNLCLDAFQFLGVNVPYALRDRSKSAVAAERSVTHSTMAAKQIMRAVKLASRMEELFCSDSSAFSVISTCATDVLGSS